MIPTGSKLLIGATVAAAIAALLYGITQDGVMGTIGLTSAAVALLFLATINVLLRDSNVAADEPAVDTCAAAIPAPGRSIWPFVMALGVVVTTVGLVTQQSVVVIGIVAVLAGGAEWALQAWAEGASASKAHNAEVRNRLSHPLEFPLVGAIGIGFVVYAFSRIMLWLSKTNTTVAFSVAAAVVLIVAFLFARRPSLRTGFVAGVSTLAVVGIFAGGAAAGIDGQRDIHEHETVRGLVLEGVEVCNSPEEFEVDEKASQTVGNRANVAANITLTADGLLEFDVPGPVEAGATALQLPRSNPSNIIFTNELPEHHRLSVDLGTIEIEEDGETVEIPNQACTSLVEVDGRQLLTLTIGAPSISVEGGYRFFVPGVDTAELELVVL